VPPTPHTPNRSHDHDATSSLLNPPLPLSRNLGREAGRFTTRAR
jgi:hypothetical protein